MAIECTLYEYLIKPNPVIQLQENSSASPYSTRQVSYPKPKAIRRWTEFSAKTVRGLFNQRLQQTLDTKAKFHDFSHIHYPYSRIHDEDSLEALIIKSNQSILLESLEHTSQRLLQQSVSMVRGGQAQLYHAWRGRAKTDPRVRSKGASNLKVKWRPDWAGLVDVHGHNNILPGDTKLSKNWSSKQLKMYIGRKGKRNLNGEVQSNDIWPIRQLLHYCIESHMRYGYIITDKELVVLRVKPLDPPNQGATIDDLYGAARDNSLVEFQSIPWEKPNPSRGLSVNLALYVLFILAANNGVLDWSYGSLLDEELPSIRPQRGLCDEYPSFSTDAGYSQSSSSNTQPHSQEARASQMSIAENIGSGRKRSRSVSGDHQEGDRPHKKMRN